MIIIQDQGATYGKTLNTYKQMCTYYLLSFVDTHNIYVSIYYDTICRVVVFVIQRMLMISNTRPLGWIDKTFPFSIFKNVNRISKKKHLDIKRRYAKKGGGGSPEENGFGKISLIITFFEKHFE